MQILHQVEPTVGANVIKSPPLVWAIYHSQYNQTKWWLISQDIQCNGARKAAMAPLVKEMCCGHLVNNWYQWTNGSLVKASCLHYFNFGQVGQTSTGRFICQILLLFFATEDKWWKILKNMEMFAQFEWFCRDWRLARQSDTKQSSVCR